MAEKWILAPPGKWEKNGRKMGKLPFLTPFLANFPIFRPIFSRFPPWGQNPFFSHFFPVSGQRPEMGSAGNQDRNAKARFAPSRKEMPRKDKNQEIPQNKGKEEQESGRAKIKTRKSPKTKERKNRSQGGTSAGRSCPKKCLFRSI